MQLDHCRIFPASVSQVYAALTSFDVQRQKADAVGALDFSMDVQPLSVGTQVVTCRRVSTVRLPEFVKALVEPSMTIVETELWAPAKDNDSRSGDFRLDIDGAPVQLRGSVHLTALHAGTELKWLGELAATVPMFRAKIAQAAAASVIATLDAEFEIIGRELDS